MAESRWSTQLAGVHPDAAARAQELEGLGYTQHAPHELKNREGVIVVAGHNGAIAPARFHRLGKPGKDGRRAAHEFEAWPESPWSKRMGYAASFAPDKDATPRLGIFRLHKDEHERHVAALYDQRALRGK